MTVSFGNDALLVPSYPGALSPEDSLNHSRFKRLTDILVSAGGLFLLAWLYGAIALLIKWDSPGPVLFRQTRLGKGGVPFTILKFRTMREDLDHEMAVARHPENRRELLYKNAHDPRLTRVGRWLRRNSLDELPQLLNILRGEMALVGPRPLPVEDTRYYRDWHWGRLTVLPGLTGLWQVSGRSRLSSEEMVRLDLYYIEHWSPWMDLLIIAKTFWVVMTRDGAY
ncbi:MAG: sugar transferase [Candidatus Sericytochromatia bacterium]|nr:sugar transferase [Candidatus Sericytochromatia bacterium]